MLKENGNEIICNEVENVFFVCFVLFLILRVDMRISFHVGSILEENSPLGSMSTWNTKTLGKGTNFIHMKQ